VTWIRTVATGSGKLRFRASIEGIDTDAVTAAAMERDAGGSDGRARRTGLSVKGVKLSQRADLVRATVEAKGITLVLADVDGIWTDVFNTQPTATTWLEVASAAGDEDIFVKSTASFPSSGTIWIDSEAITYTSKVATEFNGCTRGVFDTLAQAHYIPDGAFLRAPAVTNQPILWTGRRVRLYVYGAGDSATGDGTQIWLGVLTGEPRMHGASWTLSVDPISTILDQEVGADLSEAVQPRGIFLPAPVRWRIARREYSSGSITYLPDQPTSASDSTTIIGIGPDHWETIDDFVDDVNAQIVAATGSFTATVRCVAGGDQGYYFTVTNGASPEGISIFSHERPGCEPFFSGISSSTTNYTDTIPAASASTTYYVMPQPDVAMPGAGLVPRGIFNRRSVGSTGIPYSRVYLGGAVAVTDDITSVMVNWQGDTASGDYEYIVTDINTAGRYIDIGSENPPTSPPPTRFYTPNSLPTIRLGRNYDAYPGTGTYSLLKSIEDDNPTQLNTGAVPSFRSGDWDSADWLLSYAGVSAMGSQRRYSSLKPVKLIDFVAPDLQLAGRYLSFDSSGKLVIKPLRIASPTESATYQITRANLLTDDGFPTYERGAVGQFNTLLIHDGYSPSTDEYTLPPIKVRDVAAYGQSPMARVIKIEPKSGQLYPYVPIEEAVALASQVLGIYGGPYAYIQCAVPLTALSGSNTTIGSTVSLTTEQLPAATGVRGVSALTCLVVARDIDLYAARVELTLLASLARISGYAFGAKITAQTNTSGSTWDITVSSDYFGGSDTAEDHLEVDDHLMIYRFDSATAGTVETTVQAVSGNVITVLADSAWTPGSDEWAIVNTDADNVDFYATENQRRYCYVAASDGDIDFDSGTEPGRQFAP
jgi:hypothetical protein